MGMHILWQQSAIEEQGTHRTCNLHATSHCALETYNLIGHERRKHLHRNIQEGQVSIQCPLPFCIIRTIQHQNIPFIIGKRGINIMTSIALWHIGETGGKFPHHHAFIGKAFGIHRAFHHEILTLVNIGGIHIQPTAHGWQSRHRHHFQQFTDIQVSGNHIGNLLAYIAFISIHSHITAVRKACQSHICHNGTIRTCSDVVVAVERELPIGNNWCLRIQTEIDT